MSGEDRPDVTAGVDGYNFCPECKRDERDTLTPLPICERCYNMYSPHKETLPHWSAKGDPVN